MRKMDKSTCLMHLIILTILGKLLRGSRRLRLSFMQIKVKFISNVLGLIRFRSLDGRC